ncbi:MAG: hypothetical protein IKG42_06355 [Clostridia bacterium]|nr:hypothetical protein [Clostridia bacterium]
MLNIDLQLLAKNVDCFVNWSAKTKSGEKLESPEVYSDKIIELFIESCKGKDAEDIKGDIYGFVSGSYTPFILSDKSLASLLNALSDSKEMRKRAKAKGKTVAEERDFCEAILLDFLNLKFAGMDEDDIYFILIDLG